MAAIQRTSQDNNSSSSPTRSSPFKDQLIPLLTSSGIWPTSQKKKSTGFFTSSSNVMLIKVTILQQADANWRIPNVGVFSLWLWIAPCLLVFRLILQPSISQFRPGPLSKYWRWAVSSIQGDAPSGTSATVKLPLTLQHVKSVSTPWQQHTSKSSPQCVTLDHNIDIQCFIG